MPPDHPIHSIYLDYNATTPLDPRVLEEMAPYLAENYGNPSSIHSPGSVARAAVDCARERVSGCLGARPGEIVFTSGGSESNNFAIKGLAYALSDRGKHLITTAVEHASCLETFRFLERRGFEVTYLPVDSFGLVYPEQFREAITERTILVSCMYVNNETGVISPIREIGEIARERGVIFHTDAVQALGKVEIDFADLPVDMASFSAHKICGPKGAGALYVRKGVGLESFVHGGGQERGKRSGTENVAAVCGFGFACELLRGQVEFENKRLTNLRDHLFEELSRRIKDVYLNGHPDARVCNTLNVGFSGTPGDSVVMNLDTEDVAVSTGSACSEGNVDASHVLIAMGREEKEALSSVRFSFGRFTREEEVDRVIDLLPAVVRRIREIQSL